MRKVILDTSFIMTAVKQKIDFFEKIKYEGFKVFVPVQTIRELEGLGQGLALQILKSNDYKLVELQGKDADSAILKFAKKNPDAIIATLDQGLKKHLKNKIMIIRNLKKIEVI